MNSSPSFPAALQVWLRTQSTGSLRAKSEDLTASYRSGSSSQNVDMAAYVASRAPATYAAVSKALMMCSALKIAPKTLLDVGAGAGSASWAALNVWPQLEHVTFFDVNRAFLDLAQKLARQSGHTALNAAATLQGEVSGAALPPSDIITASYVLAELPENHAAAFALRLWQVTGQVLILVEPGTPHGFARIVRAREALIKAGASIAGPCTHAGTCPLASPDWCHFKVRLNRSREHMHAKVASVPYEDEAFSCVIAHRGSQTSPGARIIAPVITTKISTTLKLCSHAGMQKTTIASRDKPAFKRAKKLDWGDIYTGELT